MSDRLKDSERSRLFQELFELEKQKSILLGYQMQLLSDARFFAKSEQALVELARTAGKSSPLAPPAVRPFDPEDILEQELSLSIEPDDGQRIQQVR